MAAEIATGWAPVLRGIELRSGTKGVFKISIDGALVFDKSVTGHRPAAGEAAHAAAERLGPELNWRKAHKA